MIINSPLTWNTHWDYTRRGLGQDPLTNISTAFSDLWSSLGPTELLVLGIGAFALIAMVYTTSTGVSAASGFVRRRRSKRRRKSELRKEYAAL